MSFFIQYLIIVSLKLNVLMNPGELMITFKKCTQRQSSVSKLNILTNIFKDHLEFTQKSHSDYTAC